MDCELLCIPQFHKILTGSFLVQPPPTTETEMFLIMFDYIDRLFSIVRPRRLLFMAVGMQLTTGIHVHLCIPE